MIDEIIPIKIDELMPILIIVAGVVGTIYFIPNTIYPDCSDTIMGNITDFQIISSDSYFQKASASIKLDTGKQIYLAGWEVSRLETGIRVARNNCSNRYKLILD